LTYWTPDELTAFALKLEIYHRVFGVFWSMSSIAFTDSPECPTAMVYLRPGTRPRIVINGPWWNTLSEIMRIFVIVHECLHVMLEHGFRNGRLEVPLATPVQVNRAQDIPINEMIESLFKIPRQKIKDWEKFCWVSTCFPGDTTVAYNETFVYYLERLVKENKDLLTVTLDTHGDGEGGEDGAGDSDGDGEDDDSLDELYDTLTDEELAVFDRVTKTRGGGGSLAGYIERRNATRKLSINKIVRGMRTAKAKMASAETFVTRARRFSSMPDDMLLPNVHDSKRSNDRFNVALCLDVSGSVAHLRPQFYELREMFLKQVKYLEVKSYVFADRIAEITDRDQRYNVGGGNAPFQLIEHMLTTPSVGSKNPPKYPDCVIVITDGRADGVRPKHPKRWVWLLTEDADISKIPTACRFYPIADVVIG
jgi:hypothetical protein